MIVKSCLHPEGGSKKSRPQDELSIKSGTYGLSPDLLPQLDSSSDSRYPQGSFPGGYLFASKEYTIFCEFVQSIWIEAYHLRFNYTINQIGLPIILLNIKY